MATGNGAGRIAVVVAASGAAWEAGALERLQRSTPSVVLLKRCVDLHDLLATSSTGLAGVAVLSSQLPGLDVDSIRQLGRAGLGVVVVADDERADRLGAAHLLAPDAMDRLVATIEGADEDPAPGSAPLVGLSPGTEGLGERTRTGQVVAVWGPAGAPGRTTVAVGIAAELAHRQRSVLIVDADPYAGSVGQHLGVLDEASGLLGAARAANAGMLDGERLADYARQVSDHLTVLTGLPRADRWAEVRQQAFDDLVETATGLADRVVLDTGFSIEHGGADPYESTAPARNQMTLSALARADEVVVVGASDPVGLSRLARALVELHDLMPLLRPRVVVNRTRASLGWGEKEIRGMVEGFVTPLDVHFLPEDRAATDRALMAGRSLVESGDSPLREALAAVVEAMHPDSSASAPRRRPARPQTNRRGRVRSRRAGRAR